MIGNGVGCIYKKPEKKEVVVYESELETFVGFVLCSVIGLGTILLAHFI
jgi:hypothetical protein